MSYKMKNNNYFGLATESRHISFDPSSWPITVRVPRTIPLAGGSDSKSSDWTSRVLSENPMSTTGLWQDIVLITHSEQKYVVSFIEFTIKYLHGMHISCNTDWHRTGWSYVTYQALCETHWCEMSLKTRWYWKYIMQYKGNGKIIRLWTKIKFLTPFSVMSVKFRLISVKSKWIINCLICLNSFTFLSITLSTVYSLKINITR